MPELTDEAVKEMIVHAHKTVAFWLDSEHKQPGKGYCEQARDIIALGTALQRERKPPRPAWHPTVQRILDYLDEEGGWNTVEDLQTALDCAHDPLTLREVKHWTDHMSELGLIAYRYHDGRNQYGSLRHWTKVG